MIPTAGGKFYSPEYNTRQFMNLNRNFKRVEQTFSKYPSG